MHNVKNMWLFALAHLRRSRRQVFAVHLLFTALVFVLFAPLVGFVGQLLIRFSGQTALADQDIAYFLLSPPGMLALILFAALLIGIMALEQAALMRLAASELRGQRLGWAEAVIFSFARLNRIFPFTTSLVVRVLALVLPFMALSAGLAWFLISDYDINYYLLEKPAEFWVAVAGIGLVLVAMLVMLVHKLFGWLLALPLVLFGSVKTAKSFGESKRILQGRHTRVFLVLVSWAALGFLLGAVLLGAIKLLGSWFVPGASDSVGRLVVLLGGLWVLWASCNILISAFMSGSFAYLLMGMYKHMEPAFDTGVTDGESWVSRQKTIRFTLSKIAATVVIGVVAASVTGVWLLNGIQTDDECTVVAHRGAAGKAPENTLSAVRQAIEDKADWIEIDVQESADGEVVVIHDSDFMKLAGKEVKVRDATLETMQGIDIGSWFAPAFSQERVPTLEQVLETVRGRARVVIELKYYGHDKQLEQRVVDIVEDAGMVDETAIMSLKYEAVRKVRALRPNWKVGLLSATAIGDISQLDVDFLAVAMNMASAGLVRRVHKAGKKLFVWTVNDPVSMSRMMSLGVDGIITDEPEMARKVLADRAELSSAERLLIHTALLFGQPLKTREYRDESP